MYLTQLCLNRMERSAMKALSDAYQLHQTVMKGFVPYKDVARVLFRVEPEMRNGSALVLVQSTLEPDWEMLKNDNRWVTAAKVKEFVPKFRAGYSLRFRLRANPIVTREGKRYGLIRDVSLREWLSKKEQNLGARFKSMTVIDEGYIMGNKQNKSSQHRLSLKIARFEGMLEVIDPVAFSETVEVGIGPAKAFGCGLLSLAKA